MCLASKEEAGVAAIRYKTAHNRTVQSHLLTVPTQRNQALEDSTPKPWLPSALSHPVGLLERKGLRNHILHLLKVRSWRLRE